MLPAGIPVTATATRGRGVSIHSDLFGGVGLEQLFQTQAEEIEYREGKEADPTPVWALVNQIEIVSRNTETGQIRVRTRDVLVQRNAGAGVATYPGLASASLRGRFEIEGETWTVVGVAAKGSELWRLICEQKGRAEVVRDGLKQREG